VIKREAEIAFGRCVSRLQFQRFVEIFDGFVIAAFGVESESKIAESLREIRIDGEGLAELLDRSIDVFLAVKFQAAVIEFDRAVVRVELRLERERRSRCALKVAKRRRRSKVVSMRPRLCDRKHCGKDSIIKRVTGAGSYERIHARGTFR